MTSIPRHDRPCPCGLTRGQCYEQSISDEGTGHHDERVVACDEPQCRAECPRDVDASCPECGEQVGIRCRDCDKLVLPDELVTVARGRLCPSCAEEDERRTTKQKARDAYEAWCDDRGDEMRMGGGW